MPSWRALAIFCRVVARVALLVLVQLLARTARAEPALVWYRAAQGCPEGPSFLERLERRGVRARLADVGDRIDFVVTLGSSGQESSGRLERQTKEGTVAIREARAANCSSVADVLALTLALTLEPQPDSSDASSAPTTAASVASSAAGAQSATSSGPTPGDSSPSDTPAAPPATAPARPPPAAHPELDAAPQTPTSPRADARGGLALGVEASAWNLFGGAWLLAGGVAAEVRASHEFAFPTASARVVARGGAQLGSDAASLWLAALRLEGCPVAVGNAVFEARPCAAVDLGAVGASAAGDSDAAFWSALAAHVRLGAAVSSLLGLEAQVGAIVPLTRYEVTTGTPARTLEKAKPIALALGLGATFRVP